MANEKDINNIEKIENRTQYVNMCDKEVCYNGEKKLEINPSLSKRQLKKVKKREKWLERKVEIRFLLYNYHKFINLLG